MTNRRHRRDRTVSGAAAVLALVAAGCSGADDAIGPAPEPATFNTFGLDQFAETADDTDPVPINGLELTFDDDPVAFDALLD